MDKTDVSKPAPQAATQPHVLSIQSHVVYGMVGNKVAQFTLQLHGFDVDPLNVVQFSNHTGYRIFRGTRMTAHEFALIVEGLELNNILPKCTHVLSGYVGNPEVLMEMARLIEKMRNAATGTLPFFLCDPVCGDNGELYVPPELPRIYAEKVIPLAVAATPNGFEAECISGVHIVSVAAAVEAARWFHSKGVRIVVIKSFELPIHPQEILVLASLGECGPRPSRSWLFHVPKKEYYFSGTGDLMSSMLLAKIMRAGGLEADLETELPKAVIDSLGGVQAVLSRTAEMPECCGHKELCLVTCGPELLKPSSSKYKMTQL